MTTLQLRAHLEALPKELYDEIYELTFTPPTGTTIHIEHSPFNDGMFYDCAVPYAEFPLKLLQVSRATRMKVATLHFSRNIFIVRRYSLLYTWLKYRLPSDHRLLLRDVRCRAPVRRDPSSPFPEEEIQAGFVRFMFDDMRDTRFTFGYVEPVDAEGAR
ncbi:uncharacterized protein RCC_06877 [Ramularia collo-cygni]|uniref:Uncharacterized protein n=1 Tax=Ramularia collo-cygni TaxID=112498 RepID=A0A2D3VBF5_9PEZI|nr:uncharacterized protein RCC_06877 [Ramularia collo-cygni]CZT21016.1 uncharacterized protein RCC_06877 [Ramularia collo-cygni]